MIGLKLTKDYWLKARMINWCSSRNLWISTCTNWRLSERRISLTLRYSPAHKRRRKSLMNDLTVYALSQFLSKLYSILYSHTYYTHTHNYTYTYTNNKIKTKLIQNINYQRIITNYIPPLNLMNEAFQHY
jgi:hypothetical protein